jgi:anti-sigma regulatory factor (Ser/Thr protein kinase)
MNLKYPLKMTIPNRVEYLPIISKAVIALARELGFKKMDIAKIELGLEEAVVNLIETAFRKGEEATFDMILEPQTTGLKIILKEKGIPFDADLLNTFDPEKMKETYSEQGLGLFLLKQFVDEVSFLNLGKEGKETHLFKHFNNRSIDKLMSNDEMEIAKAEITGYPLPPNSVSFEIREMKEQDAIEVSKCAYSSYGYDYKEDIYFPDRVWKKNKSGELISMLSVTDGGEIMGHAALLFSDRDPLFPEMGVAFIKPIYSGQGSLNEMILKLIEKAESIGVVGLFGTAVTTHPFLQKSLLKYHFSEIALMLSIFHNLKFIGIKEGANHREDLIFMARFLKKVKLYHLFVPVHHRSIVEKLYRNLDVEVHFEERNEKKPELKDCAEMFIKTDYSTQVAQIYIYSYGTNVVVEVYRNVRLLCCERFEAIFLYLKMDDPYIIDFTPEFEKMNFFFAGIMPSSKGNGELILQYLNNYQVNWDEVKVASDMGVELKEYVRNLDPNQKI